MLFSRAISLLPPPQCRKSDLPESVGLLLLPSGYFHRKPDNRVIPRLHLPPLLCKRCIQKRRPESKGKKSSNDVLRANKGECHKLRTRRSSSSNTTAINGLSSARARWRRSSKMWRVFNDFHPSFSPFKNSILLFFLQKQNTFPE